jgi:hypothetical protein
MLDYSLLFVIQFCWRWSVCPRAVLVKFLGEFCILHSAHLFALSNDMQAGLESVAAVVAAVKNGSKFSQDNMA